MNYDPITLPQHRLDTFCQEIRSHRQDARAVAFWQSRMTTGGQRAEPPQLVDIHDLARRLRAATRESTA